MPVKYKINPDVKDIPPVEPKKKKSIDKSNVFMTKVIDGTYNFLASPWDK
tara:strand:- start:66 stop:215 length:150 start_codon:yes stop_codon:yes gene_type:complete